MDPIMHRECGVYYMLKRNHIFCSMFCVICFRFECELIGLICNRYEVMCIAID